MEKIRTQWKTVRKSFIDLSKDQSGVVEPEELLFYIQHWGFHVSKETLAEIYSMLDYDRDGKVSYQDFQKTVGAYLHPVEELYFRQDQAFS
jgi:Ca2+-binding EF-hand superfamily protein